MRSYVEAIAASKCLPEFYKALGQWVEFALKSDLTREELLDAVVKALENAPTGTLILQSEGVGECDVCTPWAPSPWWRLNGAVYELLRNLLTEAWWAGYDSARAKAEEE